MYLHIHEFGGLVDSHSETIVPLSRDKQLLQSLTHRLHPRETGRLETSEQQNYMEQNQPRKRTQLRTVKATETYFVSVLLDPTSSSRVMLKLVK